MKTSNLFLSIFFCCFSSLSFGQTLTVEQKSIIEKQVDSVFLTSIKYAESLDYDKLSQTVNDNHQSGFITIGAYYTTFDSLISSFKQKVAGVSKQSILVKRKKITVLSDQIVLLTSAGEAKIEIATGQSFTAKFYWSFVFEKTEGSWKVIHSHQSTSR